MRRVKICFFVVTVVVLTIAYFSGNVAAAEVTRMNRNRGHIFINEGKGAGFMKGAKVCFYSVSGEELLCGTILRTTDKYAVVKVNNRQIRKIKMGTEARLYVGKDE
ncbi:MAG: hypothetical protein JSW04_12770 [Desulfobacterales bacterium]|nr:MAG: hypothetical protein JSV38_16390 [Desulfobacterales bacterium]UCD89282.1 MAG: hypothetical protein JSW04_12770 [Desulfobacterales bacterium]